jgi:hypothetical protein
MAARVVAHRRSWSAWLQAAENGRIASRTGKKHTSGAKAQLIPRL